MNQLKKFDSNVNSNLLQRNGRVEMAGNKDIDEKHLGVAEI